MFPPGWDEARVQNVLAHYENQTEDEAVAEDEACWKPGDPTIMQVPASLISTVRELIARQSTNG